MYVKIQEEKWRMSDAEEDICFKITREANGVYFLGINDDLYA